MILESLGELGLGVNEGRVYIASLELGESSILRIAKKAGLKRTTVSSLVTSLLAKGLMSKTKLKNRNLYYAENPRILMRQLSSKIQVAQNVIPSLLAITNLIDSKPSVRFYEGIEEFKELYSQILLNPDQPYIAWMSHQAINAYGYDYWYNEYRPQRIKQKIFFRAIVIESDLTKKMKKDDSGSLRETRLDRSGTLQIESDVILFGGKFVAFVSFNDMIGFTIESKKIYDTLLGIYEIHWSLLGK